MLKSLETMSIEEIAKKQTENRAQIVTEDCAKTPKTVMDMSRNQCVLCDLNFIGNISFYYSVVYFNVVLVRIVTTRP